MLSFKMPLEEAQKYSIGQLIPVEVNGMKTSRMITSMRVIRDNTVRITATVNNALTPRKDDAVGYDYIIEGDRRYRRNLAGELIDVTPMGWRGNDA